MTELRVFLSPHFSEEVFVEEVSGVVFKATRSLDIHTIKLEEDKLTGVASAVRKNILLPYDKATRDFLKTFKSPAPKVEEPAKAEEPKEEAPKEEAPKEEAAPEEEVVLETKEEVKEEAKAPARKTRKKAAAKEETN